MNVSNMESALLAVRVKRLTNGDDGFEGVNVNPFFDAITDLAGGGR